ncbi:hypothetical protein J2X77_000648 [Sphingobacterium sp. 2149]|nr:hypothetical protein [Sphingobacterium sp. 2149]
MRQKESLTTTKSRQIKDQLRQHAVILLIKNKYSPPE